MAKQNKYTKERLEAAVRDSYSIASTIRALDMKVSGGTYGHLKRLIRQWGIGTEHFTGQASNAGKRHIGGPKRLTAQEILVVRDRSRIPEKVFRLRRALNDVGVPDVCSDCGQGPVWRGHPLVLQVHHIDGDRWNNRTENLLIMCPNCHSQTATFGSRNKTIA